MRLQGRQYRGLGLGVYSTILIIKSPQNSIGNYLGPYVSCSFRAGMTLRPMQQQSQPAAAPGALSFCRNGHGSSCCGDGSFRKLGVPYIILVSS